MKDKQQYYIYIYTHRGFGTPGLQFPPCVSLGFHTSLCWISGLQPSVCAIPGFITIIVLLLFLLYYYIVIIIHYERVNILLLKLDY